MRRIFPNLVLLPWTEPTQKPQWKESPSDAICADQLLRDGHTMLLSEKTHYSSTMINGSVFRTVASNASIIRGYTGMQTGRESSMGQ